MEKKLKEIKLSGISRALPPGVSPDGECCDVVNMRNENGVWHITGMPEVITESDSDMLQLTIIHSNMGYKHIVCYDGRSLFWEANEVNGEIVKVNKKIADIDGVKSLAANGNFIVAVTGCECRYLLFIENDYIYLGGLFMPELMFGLKHKGDSTIKELGFYLPETVNKNDTTFQGNNNVFFSTKIMTCLDRAKSEFRKDGYFLHPFLLRYAIRLFDGSHIFPSPPVLMMTNLDHIVSKYSNYMVVDADNQAVAYIYIGLDKYSIQLSCGDLPLEEWDNLIDGIDIFISSQKRFIKDTSTLEYWFTDIYDNEEAGFAKYVFFNFEYIPDDEKISWAEDESQFFKVASYTLAELREKKESNGNKPFDMKIDIDLEFLEQQENLDIDNFSLFDNGADTSFIYNSQLHLGSIYQYFPKPFPLYVFGIMQSTYFGYSTSLVPDGYSCFIDVTINCNDGIKTVSAETSLPAGCMLSPFISYPDSRATEMSVRLVREGKEFCIKIPLKASQVENSAIYVNSGFKPLSIGDESDSSYVFEEKRAYDYYPNRIKVSETDNVLFFPQEQTYVVSEGRILKMAAATKELSQGQYGEFPLYVFTDEGIWAMQQGSGDMLYATQHPITRDVPLSSNIICGIDNGVAYISEHGLTLLSGAKCSVISNSFDGKTEDFDVVRIAGRDFDVVCSKEIVSGFKEYLCNSSAGFDYINNELLFLCPGETYLYVYNFTSGTWYRRVIGNVPLKCFINSYPSLWLCNESGMIFNLSHEDEECIIPFAFVSRGVKGIPLCSKQLNDVILNIGYYSNPECVIHVDVAASDLPDRGFTNILQTDIVPSPRDTIRLPLHTRPFKYFRVSVCGNCMPETCLNSLVLALTPKYTGRVR